MEKLRKTLLRRTCIPLTRQENRYINMWTYSVENITWTNRGANNASHPHYPGPFTSGNVRYYHIHCSYEMWKVLDTDRSSHWDYREPGVLYYPPTNYNPGNHKTATCHMTLPIYHRRYNWELPGIRAEIFNDLAPHYQ